MIRSTRVVPERGREVTSTGRREPCRARGSRFIRVVFLTVVSLLILKLGVDVLRGT